EVRSQGACLDVAGGVYSGGVSVRTWSCNHTSAQKFQLEQRATGSEKYILRTADPSWCVKFPMSGESSTVQYFQNDGNFLPVKAAQARKLYAGDGMCVADGVTDCSRAWPLLHVDRREGWHEVRDWSECLGGTSTLASGGRVGWSACGATGNRLARHEQPVGFDLRLAGTSLCLDIPHNDPTQPLQLYGCNDSAAQRWYDADRVTTPPPPP